MQQLLLRLRYVDDIFAIFEGPKEEILHFLEYLNSLRASIKFTVEMELEGCLPFLDVSVKKLKNSVFLLSLIHI